MSKIYLLVLYCDIVYAVHIPVDVGSAKIQVTTSQDIYVEGSGIRNSDIPEVYAWVEVASYFFLIVFLFGIIKMAKRSKFVSKSIRLFPLNSFTNNYQPLSTNDDDVSKKYATFCTSVFHKLQDIKSNLLLGVLIQIWRTSY